MAFKTKVVLVVLLVALLMALPFRKAWLGQVLADLKGFSRWMLEALQASHWSLKQWVGFLRTRPKQAKATLWICSTCFD